MSRTIPHRELRNNSSAVLREVQAGETFNITNHGDVVAVLSPSAGSETGRVRIRPARIQGNFASIHGIILDHPIQGTLDQLRGER